MPGRLRPITGVMPQVSRPLLGALLAAVLLLAVWAVALRPGSAAGTATAPAPAAAPAAAPAPATAKAVAKTPAHAAAKAGGLSSAAKPTKVAGSGRSRHAIVLPSMRRARSSVAAVPAPQRVLQAIQRHQVVLVLFYNPAAAEDRALRTELNALSAPAGVVKLAAPISQLSQFPALTDAVTINQAPTFVLVDTRAQLATIAGYASAFELSTRISQALSGQ